MESYRKQNYGQAVQRRAQCSIAVLSGSSPPGKGRAKQFISTFQTLQSEPSLKIKVTVVKRCI
ncbi:hypothetical protein ACRRTK_014873 [Alexandromys fortis]